MMWLFGITVVSLLPFAFGCACDIPFPLPACPPPRPKPVDPGSGGAKSECARLGGRCYDIRCTETPGECPEGSSCFPGLCGDRGAYRFCCLPDHDCNGPLPSTTCMQEGHTFYTTFDGWNYQLQGRCKYLLSADLGGSWSVEVEHQNQADYTRVKEVTINSPCGSVITYMNQNVKVDGTPKNDHALEEGVQGDGFTLTMVGKENHVRNIRYCDKQGIVIDYDFEQLLIVRLAERWFMRMHGLCGNCDGHPANDLVDDTVEATHDAYVVGGPCDMEPNPGVCTAPGNTPTPAESLAECQAALLENPCPEVIPAGDFTMCTYENCLCNQCLCEMAEAYQSKCFFLTLNTAYLMKPSVCTGP